MNKHLLFYDGQCGLCDRAVQFVLEADHKKEFLFAPLQGKTAESKLKELPPEKKNIDSLVLIENFGGKNEKIYTHGKGALRILWLIGRGWTLLGWLSFLPSAPFDFFYRIVARNRHRLIKQTRCATPGDRANPRFLP